MAAFGWKATVWLTAAFDHPHLDFCLLCNRQRVVNLYS